MSHDQPLCLAVTTPPKMSAPRGPGPVLCTFVLLPVTQSAHVCLHLCVLGVCLGGVSLAERVTPTCLMGVHGRRSVSAGLACLSLWAPKLVGAFLHRLPPLLCTWGFFSTQVGGSMY